MERSRNGGADDIRFNAVPAVNFELKIFSELINFKEVDYLPPITSCEF